MPDIVTLSEKTHKILKNGGVFVPSPLALDEKQKQIESYQRLLSLYYIKSGAKAVIPGAHTGEFALNNPEIFSRWLEIVKEMTASYGKDMILMAAIGGEHALRQAELAAKNDYDLVMVAPTAFSGKNAKEVIAMFRDIATIIPTIGFELQRAIPGSYAFSYELWTEIFSITYGAKGASFDTYRSINMLRAAAHSERREDLILFTGNDDRIVSDLSGEYLFKDAKGTKKIRYSGGLLGHFATDTHAAAGWVNELLSFRKTGTWNFPLSKEALAHAVNHCNLELFDALGNFENSVWGVKYRLASMGLLSGPYCANETGRKGQAKSIDRIYADYPQLSDDEFVRENLDWMKHEVGLK